MAALYLDIDVKCPQTMKVRLPHLAEPINVTEAVPEFALIFDGASKENTLLFYYKINKEEDCLDFIDDDAEEEVAELLGVTITELDIDDNDSPIADGELTQEDTNMFRNYLSTVREGLDKIVRKSHSEPEADDAPSTITGRRVV